MTETKYYKSNDLALAATISLSYPLESILREEGGQRVAFLFERSAELDVLVESYWRGELQVEPKAYSSQLRLLKARIYGEG